MPGEIMKLTCIVGVSRDPKTYPFAPLTPGPHLNALHQIDGLYVTGSLNISLNCAVLRKFTENEMKSRCSDTF